MPSGRPREFDLEVALDRAVEVFWHRGFEGASLTELTEAMGINRPSLYATFGNKEELFLKALDRYAHGPASFFAFALDRDKVREAITEFFLSAIALLTDPNRPKGCLVVQGALACGDSADTIRQKLARVRSQGTKLIFDRLLRAQQEGELSPEAPCLDLARFFTTVHHGLVVQSHTGTTAEEMHRIVVLVMRSWEFWLQKQENSP